MLRTPGEPRKRGNPSASQLLLACLCFSQEMRHQPLNISPGSSHGSATSHRTCSQIPDHSHGAPSHLNQQVQRAEVWGEFPCKMSAEFQRKLARRAKTRSRQGRNATTGWTQEVEGAQGCPPVRKTSWPCLGMGCSSNSHHTEQHMHHSTPTPH